MKFGFDDNLGIPRDFAERFGLELVSFHELAEMGDAFCKGKVTAMFAPCGQLPYLGCAYEVLAQATFGPDRRQVLQSCFVVPQQSAFDDRILMQGRVACVNRYCTTSYWAPMISTLDRTPDGSPIAFQEATGFDDMLFRVADGRADAAMVWDAVLERQPAAAAKTRELFRYEGLPTPVIVANKMIDPRLALQLKDGLASYTTDSPGFFNGFAPPDAVRLNDFLERDARAKKHYRTSL